MIKLKELRLEKNLTQVELAKQLGITQAALSGWETGKFEIDNDSLMKLSKFFDVSLDFLLGAAEYSDKVLNKKIKELLEDTTDYSKFADAVGVDISTVFQWIKGVSVSCYDKIPEIASFFGISIASLLGCTDEATTSTLDEQLKGIDFALYGEVKDLTDEEKQDILDYIRYKKSKNKN